MATGLKGLKMNSSWKEILYLSSTLSSLLERNFSEWIYRQEALTRLWEHWENDLLMRNGKKQQTKFDYREVQFVNLKLDASQKKQFSQWVEQLGDKIDDECGIFISNGWKTSHTWDRDNACFIASSTNVEPDDINFQYCITSRSSEWLEAVYLNVFKFNVLANGDSLESLVASNSWG